jgi:hypothetical protein
MDRSRMTTVEDNLDKIASEVAKEVRVNPEDLSLGFKEENAAEAVPLLIDRMDKICGLMDYQATIIEHTKKELEEARYRFRVAEKEAKHIFDMSLVKFKNEDREKYGVDFKKRGRTDPEYQAMANLEAHSKSIFAMQMERDYFKAQHKLEDAQHNYETLNNHFLSYRKSCDLLKMEIERFNTGEKYKYPSRGFRDEISDDLPETQVV